MLCLRGIELYSRWVPLNGMPNPDIQSSVRLLTMQLVVVSV